MGFFDKAKLLFKADKPGDLKQYFGEMVDIPGVGQVRIKSVVPNIGMTLGHSKPKPHYYEVNGKHLISMLRFHAQMEGDESITEDDFKAFEEMEFHAEKLPDTQTTAEEIVDKVLKDAKK
jgi:hypothetical protein